MRLLLDTHVLLWWVAGDPRISPRAARAMQDPDNEIFVSVASLWEASMKVRIGKLSVEPDLETAASLFVARHGAAYLPVLDHHALAVGTLPLHHRDAFDALLVAQARSESLRIVSADPVFERYGVDVVW
jgi:PIN domain nuclease of toxin-antitoxin system